MELNFLLKVFLWITIGGIIFSLFCLAMNGAGDAPQAFTTYLLCCSIILSSCFLSMAILAGQKNKDKSN